MTDQTQTTDPLSVFKDGVDAGLLGADPRVCPWDKMTREWYEWQRGQAWGVQLSQLSC